MVTRKAKYGLVGGIDSECCWFVFPFWYRYVWVCVAEQQQCPEKAVGRTAKCVYVHMHRNIELLEGEDGEAPFDAKICVSPNRVPQSQSK